MITIIRNIGKHTGVMVHEVTVGESVVFDENSCLDSKFKIHVKKGGAG